ncbi:hypothetical protein BWQ96_00769 [Gracilariopsis chorda]|uniref:Transmembrane protein n=1 Tax=Gracilariopsis chorda TaxID=448386 RepID=A0A2V3J562_9FLOR|nr:hypothetical protein BWQ96_00769 [Gracilariopsis chorda]|eukprot:PXF49453.1 hypothetical protein BWQ96_00769 [Gracilariopsis chorda]
MVKGKNVVLLLPALVAVTATFVCRVALRKRNQRKDKQAKDLGIMDREATLPIDSDNGQGLGTRESSPAAGGNTSAITSSGEGSSQSQDEPSLSKVFGSLSFTAPVPQEMNAFSCLGNEHGPTAFDTTPGADNPTAPFSVGSSKSGRSRSRRNRGGRRGGRRSGGGRLVAAGKAGEEGGAEGAEGARGADRGGKKSRRTIAAPNERL